MESMASHVIIFIIVLYCLERLLSRNRSRAISLVVRKEAEEVNTPSQTVAVRKPVAGHLTVTTLLAMSWVTLAIYAVLFAVTDLKMSLIIWNVPIISLVAAWAVMERWRWGRLVLIGMAGLFFLDAAYAAWQLANGEGMQFLNALWNARFLRELLGSYGLGSGFGAALLLLSLITLVWLNGRAVQKEFETRKRSKTRRFQFGIAAFLLGLIVYGIFQNGLSKNVQNRLNHEPISRQQPKPKVASRPVDMRPVVGSLVLTQPATGAAASAP